MKKITVLALCVALVVPALALAQEGEMAPNTGAITLNLGVDMTTQYNFRGINMQDQGAIVHPWANIAAKVYEGDDIPGVEGISLIAGSWSSMQEDAPQVLGTSQWVELDVWGGVELDLVCGWTGSVVYMWREDPEWFGNYVEEVNIAVAYDDAGFWEGKLDLPGFNGLQPHAMVSIEVDGGTDQNITGWQGGGAGGATAGGGDVYYEIGIAPSVCILENETWPVTLTVPVTLGFGDGYYEHINWKTGAIEDESFGYVSVGADLSVPIKAIPGEFGQWEAHAGVEFVFCGEGAESLGAKRFADMDDSEIIASAGISMTY